jgi:FkbH-like protein
MMKDFTALKKNLKKDFSELTKVKLAILGDSATQFLAQAIKGLGYEEGLNLEIFEAEFNQIENLIFSEGSELYEFEPEAIVIFKSGHKLLTKYNKCGIDEQINFANNELELIKSLHASISKQSTAQILFFNFPEIEDSVYGNFSNKLGTSFLFQTRKLNFNLMEFAQEHPNFSICDLSSIQNIYGKNAMFDPAFYINTDMVLNISILPVVSQKIVNLIKAIKGKVIKCVILDLDNTTWGGIIGDDGIENIQIGTLGIGKAFTEFQYWVKKLKNRGIIIAVCSKNNEQTAKEPFEKHPDMVLKLEDITVFVANWDNKADNIRYIQGILNIGFDSMVFLDDNPFERNIVRENIEGIIVPELPEDPANYLEFLYHLDLFETVSFSKEDIERTKLYQIEAARNIEKKSFTNESDFLKSLSMISLIEPLNKFNTPRIAQLSQRSNQFNLRTKRYTETDLEQLSKSEKYHTFAFDLTDKYGNNGLICGIILFEKSETELFIDTWFMSCRVLKRGMEQFVLNTIAAFALSKNFNKLIGEYIPTLKNEMVKNHYENLGFTKVNDYWELDVSKYQPLATFITPKYNPQNN